MSKLVYAHDENNVTISLDKEDIKYLPKALLYAAGVISSMEVCERTAVLCSRLSLLIMNVDEVIEDE